LRTGFLEVNGTSEKLTGLKAENLIGNTARIAIPGIEKVEFDWIGFYGEIAMNGGEREFEQFSGTLRKWYRVHALTTEKLAFTTMFADIATNTYEWCGDGISPKLNNFRGYRWMQ